MPWVFMRAEGDEAIRRTEAIVQEHSAADVESARRLETLQIGTIWTAVRAQIDVYPFGVGTIAVTYEVQVHDVTDGRQLDDLVDAVGQALVEPLNEALRRLVGELRDAVLITHPEVARAAWIEAPVEFADAAVGKRRRRRRGARDTGMSADEAQSVREREPFLLWLHRVFLLETGRARIADWDGLAAFLHRRDEFTGLTFVPGTGATVAISDTRIGNLVHEDLVLKVVGLAWAYYAAFAEIDRTLFVRLNRLRNSRDDARELERELGIVLALYDEVRLFRARCNTQLIDFGGGTIALWEAICDVQRIPQLERSVDDKIDAIQGACIARINELLARRERRLAISVVIFTAFTVVSSVVQVAAYIFGSPSEFEMMRTAWVTIVILTAAILSFASLRSRGGQYPRASSRDSP